MEENQFNLTDYVNVMLLINAKSNSGDSNLEVILNEIKNDMKKLKKDIRDTLHSYGYESESHLWKEYSKALALNSQLKQIEDEINKFNNSDLLNELESVATSVHEELERARYGHEIALIRKAFEDVHQEMQTVEEDVKAKKYSKAIGHNDRASQMAFELYEKLDECHQQDMPINSYGRQCFKEFFTLLDAIKSDITVNHEQIIYDLKEMFKSNINIEMNQSKDCVVQVKFQTQMKQEEYQHFIEAIIKSDLLDSLLTHFLNTINQLFLIPLLSGNIHGITRESDTTILASANGNQSMIQILKSFILFISQVLNTKDNETLSLHLGRLWKASMFECIITHYLKPSIPKSKTEIENYKRRIKDAQEMREFLISNGFIESNEEEASPFNEFMSNIDSDFLTRMCHDYIYRAKQIICQDLSETVIVGQTQNMKSNPELSLFLFPKSRVSVSLVKLLELLEEIFKQTNQMKDKEHSLTLEATIRNICELYLDIAPIKHKKIINELPQQNAIFHNNCLYLAHSIQILFFQYHNIHDQFFTLLDFIPIFRQLGSEVFLKHLKEQEKILLGFMQDPIVLQYLFENANANEDNSSHKVNPFEQAIRRCTKHLTFLQSTFVDVLPRMIYDKAIGTLANTIVSEIIHKVVTLDDISSHTTNQLSKDFAFIITQMPTLFDTKTNDRNVATFIPKWNKFCELKFILTAGLADLIDRWADGHGPLAAEFTPEEVKALIRALFQNTDRRAMALAKIKSSNF